MKKIWKYFLGVLLGTMFMGVTAFADEAVTITQVDAVLYSNELAVLYAEPDLNATVVLDEATFPDNLAIHVTGITSNGFFQVYLGETYYVPGYGLTDGSVLSGDTDTTGESASSEITVDLGYGITLVYPASIKCYYSYSGNYRGAFHITNAALTDYDPDSSRILGKLNLIYVADEYVDDTLRAEIQYYDQYGYELDTRYISMREHTYAVGESITDTVNVPPGTVLIKITGTY